MLNIILCIKFCHLFFLQESITDDTSELRLIDVFNSCGAYSDKKARKKHGFVLEPIDAENHEQVYGDNSEFF